MVAKRKAAGRQAANAELKKPRSQADRRGMVTKVARAMERSIECVFTKTEIETLKHDGKAIGEHIRDKLELLPKNGRISTTWFQELTLQFGRQTAALLRLWPRQKDLACADELLDTIGAVRSEGNQVRGACQRRTFRAPCDVGWCGCGAGWAWSCVGGWHGGIGSLVISVLRGRGRVAAGGVWCVAADGGE